MKSSVLFTFIAAANIVCAERAVNFYYDRNCKSFAGMTPIDAERVGVKSGPWGSNSATFQTTEGLSEWQFLFLANDGSGAHYNVYKPAAGVCHETQVGGEYGIYFTIGAT